MPDSALNPKAATGLHGVTEHVSQLLEDEDYDTHNRTNLIRLLVLEAGRLMEDAFFDCALSLPIQGLKRSETLDRLMQASTTMQAVLQAVLVLDDLRNLNPPGPDTPPAAP